MTKPIIKGRRPVGFFTAMSDRRVLQYTYQLWGEDVTRGELAKKDNWLYCCIIDRKLVDNIKRNPSAHSQWQTFEEWKNYGINNGYNERNPTSLSESNDKEERSWYARGWNMREKRWMQRFSFMRKNREKGFFNSMSNRRILQYTFKLHGRDVTRFNLSKKDQVLYSELLERKLIGKIKRDPIRDTKWKTFEEWINYGLKNKYDQRNPMSLYESENGGERSWYRAGARTKEERRLLRFPFKRKQKEKGYWKNWENVERETWEAIEKNDGIFPSHTILRKRGRSSLYAEISTNHGGRYAVMERIGYYEAKRTELAQELEQMVSEL